MPMLTVEHFKIVVFYIYISTDPLSVFTDPYILLDLCYHNFLDLQGSLDVLLVH